MQKEKKGAAFKVTKNIEDEPKASNEMDEIESNFVRRLNKGAKQYKGKLSFKCLSCGRIDHYASRCTYKEHYGKIPNDDNKGKDSYNKNYRIDYRDRPKKNLCSMETYSSRDEDGDDSNQESLFLAIEEKKN